MTEVSPGISLVRISKSRQYLQLTIPKGFLGLHPRHQVELGVHADGFGYGLGGFNHESRGLSIRATEHIWGEIIR